MPRTIYYPLTEERETHGKRMAAEPRAYREEQPPTQALRLAEGGVLLSPVVRRRRVQSREAVASCSL